MIDVYLFNAMFAVQILLISVLIPRRLLQRACEGLTRNPPDARGASAVKRTLGRFRAANAAIAIAGVLLMGYLFSYMREPGWDEDPVPLWQTGYYLLQFLPLTVLGLVATYVNRTLRATLTRERRTAVLQRRALFDFVSPSAVILTLACFPLAVALAWYLERKPFVILGIMTFVYSLMGILSYRLLHGRKGSPLQTHAEHLQQVGVGVRILVYSCLIAALSIIANLVLVLLDSQHLVPFVVATTFVAVALWVYVGLKAPPVAPSTGPLQPGDAS